MTYMKKKDPNQFTTPHGSVNYPIFTYDDAPIKGVCASDAEYQNDEYPNPGIHEDHEGFYVYEGTGWAKVGEEEFELSAGTCFYAPAGVYHQIKKSKKCDKLRIFLFHFQ